MAVLGAVALYFRYNPVSPPPMSARIAPRPDPVSLVLAAAPKNDYERAVFEMFEIMQAPDAMQQICSQWFPVHGHDVADAFVQWRAKHAAFMKDVTDRTHAIWIEEARGDARVVPIMDRYRREQRYKRFMSDFDATPTKEFDATCARYPKVLLLPSWDLPVKFRRELAIVKSSGPAAPAS